MKFIKFCLFFLIAAALASFWSAQVFADPNAPASIDIACSKYNYPWCGSNQPSGIADLVGKFYKYALAIVGVAAFAAIIYGGILWSVSEAAGTKQQAKDYIMGAIYGLILLLSAYLILKTINPNLTTLTEPNITPLPGQVSTGGGGGGGGGTDDAIRNDLSGHNVSINKSDCTAAQTATCFETHSPPSCTSLDGLPQSAISGLEKLGDQFGNIMVTGGTECGHKEHGPGKPVVDIAKNIDLSKYRVGNITQTRIGPRYNVNINGLVFNVLQESNHWHIVF